MGVKCRAKLRFTSRFASVDLTKKYWNLGTWAPESPIWVAGMQSVRSLRIGRTFSREHDMRAMRSCGGVLLACFVASALGCQGRGFYRQNVDFRHAMIDMYTEQAMDNLIRAREGLPFVQLAFSGALIQDVDTFNLGTIDAFTPAASRTTGPTGAWYLLCGTEAVQLG